MGSDSRDGQTEADVKAISLSPVKRAASSHRPALFDVEHVSITFMSVVEVMNNPACDLHVNLSFMQQTVKKKKGPSSPSMNCFSWLHWYQSWCFHVCVTSEPKYMWIVCWWQTRREETFQTCSKSEAASKEIKVKMLTKFWRNYANFMCAQQKKRGDFWLCMSTIDLLLVQTFLQTSNSAAVGF